MATKVYTGLDGLGSVAGFPRGARLGLMTNPTGISADGRENIGLLHEQYNLTALFAVEHGIRGNVQAGERIAASVDADTGVPVYSCYGGTHSLTDDMLDAFDAFVFDMQDVGARFYTYLYSLAFAMRDCARAGKPVYVLDRPNPLGGLITEGTLLDERFHSFVGEYAIPTRYGLTIGEFALWARDHLSLDLELHVVPMRGWTRAMRFSDTGLLWPPPSPNIPSLESALCYIGTCVFEGTNVSEGRGTALPFQMIGAPWVDDRALAERVNALKLPGVFFRRAHFTPTFSKHAGQLCHGVQMHVTDAEAVSPFAAGLYLLEEIRALCPEFSYLDSLTSGAHPHIDLILGTDEIRRGAVTAGELIQAHAPRVRAFAEAARAYHLYS